MFNLDSLNEERLEVAQNGPWRKGCIPESQNSFIETLVQRVDRGRFRFELGGPSDGPSLLLNQTEEAQPIIPQNLTCPFHEFETTQHDTSLIATQTSNPLGGVGTLTLGPGPPSSPSPITPHSQDNNPNSSTNTNFDVENTSCTECSRKIIGLDIRRLGRNIR